MNANAAKNMKNAREWAKKLDFSQIRPTISGEKLKKGKHVNIKLQSIPSLSMLPIHTCVKGAACAKNCYAARMLSGIHGASISKGWTKNWQMYLKNPARYWESVRAFLVKRQPEMFRFNVGGDIPDQAYLDSMVSLAEDFPLVKFLAFTKRTDLSFKNGIRNLKIVFSVWPGMKVPHNVRFLPKAYLGGDKRIPKDVKDCPGQCDICGKCWNLKSNESIFFHKH